MWHAARFSSFPVAPNASFPDGLIVKRPILEVDVRVGSIRIPTYCLVDTGSDHCMFPLSLGRKLGLRAQETRPVEITGVSRAAVEVFYSHVEVELPGITAFAVYAGFTDGLESLGIGLLGHIGFFDRFRVLFDHSAGIFQVEIP